MHNIYDLHERYLSHSEVFSWFTRKTIKWLRSNFSIFLRFKPIKYVEDINRWLIESFIIHSKVNRWRSAKTIKNSLCYLNMFFKWCLNEEIISENPTVNISRPKVPRRTLTWLSAEEAEHLIEYAKNMPCRYKFCQVRGVAAISMFIYTWIRYEELRNLKLSEVDMETRVLFIKSWKGNKDRLIPMPIGLIEILNKYLKHRDRLKRKCIYFFTSSKYDQEMSYDVLRRYITDLREYSGIFFYAHKLRRTFATLMLEGGCDLYALAKMMGHSDISTTERYLSATVKHLQRQVAKHPLNCGWR